MIVDLPADGWRPRPYQLPLWSYLEHGGRDAVAIWHRRSGKDEVCMHFACVAAHRRVGVLWHMLPEANQGRRVIWDAINAHTGKRRIDEAFPPEIRKRTLENDMKIELQCGSIWQVVGSDNFNSLIGSPPVGIVYSEWAVADPRAHGYLRPILAENGGWAVFVTTPRGYNHGFTSYETARTDPHSFAQMLTAQDTGVFSVEQLDRERAAYRAQYGEYEGDALFRQEYLCDFSASNVGAILGRYVEDAEKAGRINESVRADHEVEISADIGRRDTAAWWFWEPRPDGFALVDYDGDTGLVAEDWVERLKNKGHRIAKIWLPHDARARTFLARKSVLDQFCEGFGDNRIRIVPSTKIADRINAARVVMPRCHFNRTRCKEGLAGLRSWSYEFNEETKAYSKDPKHDWASHPGDAFSYGALVMQERQVAAPKPRPIDLAREAVKRAIKPLTFDEVCRRQDERNERGRRQRI